MTEQEIIELVNTTMAEEFELDLTGMFPEKTLFGDLGLDSLDIVDLVIALETAFKFRIRDEEAIKGIRTLGDIHTFIINKKNALEAGK